MSSCFRTLSSTAAALALSAVTATADPIQITAGSLVWHTGSPIDVTLSGEGFTFSGGTNRTEGELPAITLSETEQKVYDSLEEQEETSIDEIIRASRLAPSTVSVALLGLEMKRLIRQLPGKCFVRIR